MANGEPTMVTVVMRGLNTPFTASAPSPVSELPATGSSTTGKGGAKGDGDSRKRDSDERPDRECYYCGKKGHTANVCHARKRDERNKQPNQSNNHAPTVTTQTSVQLSEEERRILAILGQLLKK